MFSSAAVIAFFSTILTTVLGLNELFEAIMAENEAKVIDLIERSSGKNLFGRRVYDIHLHDYVMQQTPLEFAIAQRKENMAVTLIKKGANDRPLREAIGTGMEKVVRLMLEDTNVDVNEEIILTFQPDKVFTTFLHEAISSGKAAIVKMICDKGADLEKTNYFDFTPLQYVIHRSVGVEIVRILLEAGADVNGINSKLDTALHFAASYQKREQSREMMNSLLSVEGINIEEVNIYGFTPLLSAARYAIVESMQMLLNAGANVHASDNRKQTILHHPMSRDNEDIINLAKSYGFDFECRDENGDTPFLYSARYGDVNAMRALAKAGAKINVYNKENQGVIQYAALSYRRPAEMVEFSLCYGENSEYPRGKTEDLHLLDRRGEMGRLTRNILLEAGLLLSTERNMELLKHYWPPCHEASNLGNYQNFEELFRKATEALLKNDNPKLLENVDEYLINLIREYELKGAFALFKILKTIYGKKEPATDLERRKFKIHDCAVMIIMEGTYLTTLPVDLTSDILLYNAFYRWKLDKMSFYLAVAFDELNDVSLDQVKKAAIKLRGNYFRFL